MKTEDPSAERELFVSWLSSNYPHAWPRWQAENAWRHNHVAALAWRYCRASSAAAVPATRWVETRLVNTTLLMSPGYDWEPFELCRLEMHTPAGSFAIWPDRIGGKRWSIYSTATGHCKLDAYTEQQAKAECEMIAESLAVSAAAVPAGWSVVRVDGDCIDVQPPWGSRWRLKPTPGEVSAMGLAYSIFSDLLAATPAPPQAVPAKVNRYCSAGMCVETDTKHEPDCPAAPVAVDADPLTDDDMRQLRTAADIAGLSQEFAELEARAVGAGSREPLTDAANLPAALFDGFAVLQALTPDARARTSAENVADTLDAVVRVIRSGAARGKA